MEKGQILIVDDEESILNALEAILADEGYGVLKVGDGAEALATVRTGNPDLVLLDIWIPGMDGIETLQAIKKYRPDLEVIVMSGHGSVDTAVKVTKLGAFDFIEKPFSLDQLLSLVRGALEHQRWVRQRGQWQVSGNDKPYELLGVSQIIHQLNQTVERLSQQDDNVMILGENGTGKELIARLIHHRGPHKNSPFVKVNCAIIQDDSPPTVLTDPYSILRTGRWEAADNITLFLDEIDKMSPTVQARLAKVLIDVNREHHSAVGIGQLPLRILAAANPGLQTLVAEGTFRLSLYNLISQRLIAVPPLRQRREDVPTLVRSFANSLSAEYGAKTKEIDDEALLALVNYDWPGNIKELKNVCEQLILAVPSNRIGLEAIPLSLRKPAFKTGSVPYDAGASFAEAKRAWEREFLVYHLRNNNWQIDRTAKALKMKEPDLVKRAKSYAVMLPQVGGHKQVAQRTLKRSVVLCGQGLHSGLKTGMILLPLPANSGIHFGNIATGDTIPAHLDYVESAEYATTLKKGKTIARTIEHIMAVLHMYRITNLLIKISDEVPIMDGSAKDFCQLIEDGGIEEQEAPIEDIVIDRTFTHGQPSPNSKFIVIEPADTLTVSYSMEYPPPIGKQSLTFHCENEEAFRHQIAPARTFGFVRDAEKLEEMGLISGGKLSNLILLDDEKIINTTLRFEDEFARHKILDILGDFYLLGRFIRGSIRAHMSGHSENVSILKQLQQHLG